MTAGILYDLGGFDPDEPDGNVASRSGASVLWDGTFADTDWQSTWGLVVDNYANYTVGTFAEAGDATCMKATVAADTEFGIAMWFDFDQMSPAVATVDECYLTYRVFFRPGYQFTHATGGGGKLPGLQGHLTTAARTSNGGGVRDLDGWSGRLLFTAAGGCSAYLYVPSPTSAAHPYGWAKPFRVDPSDDLSDAMLFSEGWNTIRLHYKMNTPGVADGWMRGWINGDLGLDYRTIEYRDADHPTLGINGIRGQWYFGGGQDDYPPQDERLYLGDVALTTAPI